MHYISVNYQILHLTDINKKSKVTKSMFLSKLCAFHPSVPSKAIHGFLFSITSSTFFLLLSFLLLFVLAPAMVTATNCQCLCLRFVGANFWLPARQIWLEKLLWIYRSRVEAVKVTIRDSLIKL